MDCRWQQAARNCTCRGSDFKISRARFHRRPLLHWRHGQRCFLASSLTRAVIFSAATTASGFGTLWLSIHPGAASMGELLMISLGWVLVTTLFLSPALLGQPPEMRRFHDPEV